MKIVINRCWGGFGLSDKVLEMLGAKDDFWEFRTDPRLIEIVEKLGKEANGHSADLVIENIPDEATDWEIDDYDGMESVVYVVDGKIHHL